MSEGGSMNDQTRPSNEELEELLREGADTFAPVPEGFTDMVMTGWDIVNVDAVVAQLVEDTALVAVEGVRTDELGARLLTFRSEGVTFEFEIGPEAPHIVGTIDPPQPGAVVLEQAEDAVTVDLDEGGRFAFELLGAGPFRLRFVSAGGEAYVTDWVIP